MIAYPGRPAPGQASSGTTERPAVLVIAATDSSGGAGLTRDVRVLSDFSVDALCVVTAVTAQSDQQVTAIEHMPPEIIRAQIAGALQTRSIGAIKVGMLGTCATVEAVVTGLATNGGSPPTASIPPILPVPLIIDPVLVASSGGILLDDAGRTALLERLLPLATLVTPNLPEVAALLGEPVVADETALIQQGLRLLQHGGRAVLLKGGHGGGDEAVDLLIGSNGAVVRISSPRVAGSSRGTGCALASAIAAGLASGVSLPTACREAKEYVMRMLVPLS